MKFKIIFLKLLINKFWYFLINSDVKNIKKFKKSKKTWDFKLDNLFRNELSFLVYMSKYLSID